MKPIDELQGAPPRCRTSLHESTCSKPSQALARRTLRSILIALFAFVSAATSGLLPGLVTSASAQATFVYEQLKSFGNPSIGGNSKAELIQGAGGTLYGTASSGGTGYGTVFKVNQAGSDLTVLHYFDHTFAGHEFDRPEVGCSFSRLIQGTDGALYGTSMLGGSSGYGTVFKLNTDGTGFSVLLSFDLYTTGGNPRGGLVQGTDGALYGTAREGGSNFTGTVFKLNTDGSGFAIIKHFDSSSASTSGSYPHAGLAKGADGVLYGTTTANGGGGNSVGHYGTIFKLNQDGSDFTVLKNFDSSDPSTGSDVHGRLLHGADGALYGTAWGGSLRGGTVFKLNTDGSDFTVIKSLDLSTTGAYPFAGLIQGPEGTLYGTTNNRGESGYGTVFKVNTDGSGFTVLKNLDFWTGGYPFAELVRGADGALYGTTSSGGSGDGGTVFKLNSDGSDFTVVQNLSNVADISDEGGFPGVLMQGTDGALYGTAAGGSNGFGTLFKMNPNGSGFSVLLNFDPSTTGAYPIGLIQGADRALYGTAEQGGSSGGGTVFKLNPDGTAFTVLLDGVSPTGLIQGADGALYGTGNSMVFKLNADGTGFTVLKNFEWSTIGESGGVLSAGLIQGMDGALYGTTALFGSYEIGTVFKLNTDGTGFTVLKQFDYTTSGSYNGGLTQGMDGALYGTTDGLSYGMASEFYPGWSGTVFKLNTDGTGFEVLLNLENSSTGGYPHGALMQATDGAFYGTAAWGGSSQPIDGIGYGTVFKLNLDGTGSTALLNFDSVTTGAHPYAGLIQGADGNLYGTTRHGGDANGGTVFRIIRSGLRISMLTPPAVPSGSGAFTLTLDGFDFAPSAVVQWNGTDLDTTLVNSSQLTAAVTIVPITPDILTALITVRNPDGTTSSPKAFVVTAVNVAEVQSDVAESGETVSVSTAPIGTGNTAGITATVMNSGDPGPVTVSVAIYSSNPSPSTAFEIDSATGVAGEFLDLQVTGADAADTLGAYFYYPTDAPETGTSPTLKYHNGTDWLDVVSSGGSAPAKDTADNLAGTVSGGRFTVYFDTTSTPGITALGGTFFAVTYQRPPLGFAGFLAPIGGADVTGGSFDDPVRTFKAGSTIPVKFTASRDGVAIVTGVHTLQATKYSNKTTSETPIDATPQGQATTGNRFELHGSQWHFNLDTKATGLTKGVWQFVATLSDGSQHSVWVQIK